MPVCDMPLAELKQYTGTNPRPADFTDYWHRAIAELNNHQYSYRIEKSDFSAPGVECLHLYFIGVGNAEIHARFIKPLNITAKIPAVAYFHGYCGNCGDWYSKLPYAQSGIAIAMMDVRGQAGKSQDNLRVSGNTVEGHLIRGIDEKTPDSLFFRNVYLDTVQLVRILMSMDCIDETRVGTAGFSQGGALTLACAALEPRISVACAGYPFLCDYKRVWELNLAENAYKDITRYFRLQDPMHITEEQFWNRLGYIDIQWLAERITAQTTFFTGLADIVCPPSTQFACYNKIRADKSMVIYPEYGHETLPDADEQVWQLIREYL